MEQLQYVVEDSTIAELLGVQNFTNDESAVLELVKNAYDAKAKHVTLEFSKNQLIVDDDGDGMDASDIKQNWMHVGKSLKEYAVIDDDGHTRILAGSKGIGRFALSRLGRGVTLYSKKEHGTGIVWITDWNTSTLDSCTLENKGTRIIISDLREKWTKKKVSSLAELLSKTYNDTVMDISIKHPEIETSAKPYFPTPELGINCLSKIVLEYQKDTCLLVTTVESDEFKDSATSYCPKTDIKHFRTETDMIHELKASEEFELSVSDLEQHLKALGNFSATFYFNVNSTQVEIEKFLYKYGKLDKSLKGGVVLYRNAFSISAYEGKKDWLGLGKRSRKSPAAASHPTGSWRVRENQLAGKVIIDKNENAVLQDLSNRQGLDENVFFNLFVEIILTGLKEFERYRQGIVRCIDKKNIPEPVENPTPISDRILANPISALSLTEPEAQQLSAEIKASRKESSTILQDKESAEERYKYDVRILNVLATTGLKASSIAHEMQNDRNSISTSTDNIVAALQEYGLWEDLLLPEHTEVAFKNVPYLLSSNKKNCSKVITFMDTMLAQIEKKQFESSWQSIADILRDIKQIWERDYAFITITNCIDEDICYFISGDVLRVILDNLILNSIQQNEKNGHLNIQISICLENNLLQVSYHDDGKGLDAKYAKDPFKILEVHETTRRNDHGLGMWIINNTVVMSGGQSHSITGTPGFGIEFTVGGKA